jgi:hypothetical protein
VHFQVGRLEEEEELVDQGDVARHLKAETQSQAQQGKMVGGLLEAEKSGAAQHA